MDTRLRDDLYRADALKRHMFVSAEPDNDDSWLGRHRRAAGGELCICGLVRRNARHYKTRRHPAR